MDKETEEGVQRDEEDDLRVLEVTHWREFMKFKKPPLKGKRDIVGIREFEKTVQHFGKCAYCHNLCSHISRL